jgi:hypothetical protein
MDVEPFDVIDAGIYQWMYGSLSAAYLSAAIAGRRAMRYRMRYRIASSGACPAETLATDVTGAGACRPEQAPII